MYEICFTGLIYLDDNSQSTEQRSFCKSDAPVQLFRRKLQLFDLRTVCLAHCGESPAT